MFEIRLSLFASAVRPHMWRELLNSLKGGQLKYQVVFAGFIDEELYKPFMEEYPEFKYVQTEDIKPAQCYEIARRNCSGELVCWIADDCVFSEGFVDNVVNHYTKLCTETIYPIVISCKTNENSNNETMLNHRFFGRNQNTPLMAPLGVMSSEYLNKLGGIDNRYICGQYENDLVMRVLMESGKVYLYEDVCVSIDHKNKHGSETNFWSGYNEDREILENSWVIGGYKPNPEKLLILPTKPGDPAPYFHFPINNTEVTLNRNDKFEPYTYPYETLLKKSESNRGQWS